MKLIHTFQFAAAHQLTKVPEDHKCGRMHGHTYTVELHLEGPVDQEAGWVIDFSLVKEAWAPLHERLDHHTLNDVVSNPTAERLAAWVAMELTTGVLDLSGYLRGVTVWETPYAAAVYEVPTQVTGQVGLL